MTETQKLPWKRLLAEPTAIVLNILLVFAIDAWWEDRNERKADFVEIQSAIVMIEAEHRETSAAFINNVLDRYKLQQIALRDIGPIIDAVDRVLILLEDEISG